METDKSWGSQCLISKISPDASAFCEQNLFAITMAGISGTAQLWKIPARPQILVSQSKLNLESWGNEGPASVSSHLNKQKHRFIPLTSLPSWT